MKFKNLKNLSISALILIILNKDCSDILRRMAEVELRSRLQGLGLAYDDLLHQEEKVVKDRGFDVRNYLMNPKVSMQQLMETYFMFGYNASYDENGLLFSEKHLCNEFNFGQPFFSKICSIEIDNIADRIRTEESDYKGLLAIYLELLESMQRVNKEERLEELKKGILYLMEYNDATFQLEENGNAIHKYYVNMPDDKLYKMLCSKLGFLRLMVMEKLDDTWFKNDFINDLYALRFVKRDEKKLSNQKRQLFLQAASGYQVDYNSPNMQKGLARIRKM